MDISVLLNAGVTVILLAVVFLIWRYYQHAERPETLGEWAAQVEAASQWGKLAVAGAQQLWESGQIDEEQRFEYADAFLAETLPNLSADQRRQIIESAVFLLKRARERMTQEAEAE